MARNHPDVELVAISFADGSVGVMSFVTTEYRNGVPQWSKPATDAAIDAEVQKTSASLSDHPPIVSWRRMDRRELPEDRVYRNALTDKDGTLQHDMPKARNIHRDRMREARVYKLQDLDVAMLRVATEITGPKKTQGQAIIAEKKQRLRDITQLPEIEAAQTVDELKAIWPDELK